MCGFRVLTCNPAGQGAGLLQLYRSASVTTSAYSVGKLVTLSGCYTNIGNKQVFGISVT